MNKNLIKKVGIGAGLGISLLLPLLAMAQVPGIPGPIITSPSGITRIIVATLNWIAGIVFVISVIMLLYAAILYMTAGASETTLAKSKTTLIYAIVGIAVAILALSIQPFLESFLRANFN